MNVAHGALTTGITDLDQRLGGLAIGDNVIWYDAAGSLVSAFALNFIQASLAVGKALIYVSFDRSPKTLIQELGNLADNPRLTIVDCFTEGKGEGSALFNQFYMQHEDRRACRVIKATAPDKPGDVIRIVYAIQETLTGDVRLVFESLTGMQELWGSEALVLRFYSRACPRLYELETIAYWVIERQAHTPRLRANINKIAQVVMDLTLKRGRSTLTIVKAQGRRPQDLNKPVLFWNEDDSVYFESAKQALGKLDLATRLKTLRRHKGLSQKDLARGIGVTPSTISQIEGHLIYPSLPALVKIAEILAVDLGALFEDQAGSLRPVVFREESQSAVVPDRPHTAVAARRLLPPDAGASVEIYQITIQGPATIDHHFFTHKGQEIGYLLSGRLEVVIRDQAHDLTGGHLVCLTTDTPARWRNPTRETARLLWLKFNP
jgi:transcriptional regulator with XRE-family HTH domain/KaiC/GvpD/RAD55 family RecA-like ATPase